MVISLESLKKLKLGLGKIKDKCLPGIKVTLYLPPYLVGSKDSGERVAAVARALLEGAAKVRRVD